MTAGNGKKAGIAGLFLVTGRAMRNSLLHFAVTLTQAGHRHHW